MAAYFYTDIKALFYQKWTRFWYGYQALLIFYLIIVFLYTKREKILKLKPYKNSISQAIIFGITALIFLVINFETISNILGFDNIFTVYYINFGIASFFIFLAIFNINFALKKFLSELITIIGVIILSWILISSGPEYSKLLVRPIQWGLQLTLPYFMPEIEIIPIETSFLLDFHDFRLNVLPACSGIYSLTVFSLLYLTAIIFRKERDKINLIKAIIYWALGLFILYILNIIRIVVIIYLASQVSEEFAIKYFHEYASSIFLLTIFIIYLYFIIPKIGKSKK